MNYNYNPYQNYGMYQQPTYQQQMTQPQMMQQTQQQYQQTKYDAPIQDIKFVTADEAKAYIVMPNTKVMLMDRDKSIFYIKSADSLGKSTLEGFKYSRLEDESAQSVSPQIDTKDFIRREDLQSVLSGFLTREDVKDFITKDELKGIDNKLENFQKQMLGNMLKGGNTNGKQPN